MQTPYIPAKDADFATWFTNFKTLIAAEPTDYGLIAGDATAITAAWTPWQAAYVAASNPATRTAATIAEKDAQRTNSEAVIRPYATAVSRNPSVSNELKIGLGVNLPNSLRTPIPPPTTAPALSLQQSIHFQVTLAYYDTSTPDSKAKPFGAVGMQVFRFLGLAPGTDPELASYYALATKSPQVFGHSGPEIGKTATFWGRWITKSGPGGAAQVGPWSAPLSLILT